MPHVEPPRAQDASSQSLHAEHGSGGPFDTATRNFVYPWAAPGLPPLSPGALLAPHEALIRRIKVCYGAATHDFDRDIMSLVRRYAAAIHLLPATPDNYFSVPGGLLHLGLETAFFALQGTDAHIFSGRSSISMRRHLEPRWRLATFIGGLCSEVQRTLSRVIVRDHEGNEWPSYLSGLYPWLEVQRAKHYHLKWQPSLTDAPGLALFILPHVVTAEMLQYLATENQVVVPHLMSCLCGMPVPRENNILDELVRRSSALVIERFLSASADHLGKPLLGSHLARHVIEGFRRLLASSASWQPNTDRSRVWLGQDGLFLVWPGAAVDLCRQMEAEQLPGMPTTPEPVLEALLGAGMAEPQAPGRHTWMIQPPGSKDRLDAVRLSAPSLLLTGSAARTSPLPHPLSVEACPSPSIGAVKSASTGPAPPSAERHGTEASCGAQPGAAMSLTPASVAGGEPMQLELIEATSAELAHGEASRALETDQATAPGDRTPAPRGERELALTAPLRLAPAVRLALEQVIELVRTGSDVDAQLDALGLIVALHEFECRGVPPPFALRALSDCQMLSGGSAPDSPSHLTLERPGQQTQRAIAISPRFLVGESVPEQG